MEQSATNTRKRRKYKSKKLANHDENEIEMKKTWQRNGMLEKQGIYRFDSNKGHGS